ncbi:hypothetical protein IRJ41_007726 [Triplophysa rosa]|uniref:Uncharacterized protein n=1 Tax=Triplophysa rosa TaxID=992332 RepID=A0A9W7T249_TRIRA|nr:hypothetical protein IRJ41_007726 [Triplophysa rosa]
MEELDDVSLSILKAANIDEALLYTLSRDDLRDLFPGPEHFLRRKRVWALISTEDDNPTLSDKAGPSETVSALRGTPPVSSQESTPLQKKSPKKTLQLPSPPEYVVYTDTELEQVRKHYFEMARTGREKECFLSKELRCRLVRNTVTSMISILRASLQGKEVRYPPKHEVTAMAKRIVEYYPILQDKDNSMKHVMGELCRILDKGNSKLMDQLKKLWEHFCTKVQFYAVWKKVMKPPMTLDGVDYAKALFRALPTLFPSPVAPPKKLGHASEALLLVLQPTEDPTIYLQKRPLFSPVLLFDGSNCLIAIGTTPITTFAKEDLREGLLYLMAYYYTLHLTYPKCVATLLSVIQTEILQDAIHERDATASYKKAMAEWKDFIGN